MIQLVRARTEVSLRVMIFIDAGYFTDHWLKNECKIPRDEFNFRQFSKKISVGFTDLRNPRLIRTYYYDGLPDERHAKEFGEQKDFHDNLNRLMGDFQVRTGKMEKRDGEWIQKGVDAVLAVDMVEKAFLDQYDVAIIVAGDQDHLPAVEAVKNRGKQVFGVYYENSYSSKLINAFDLGYVLEKEYDASPFVIDKDTKEIQQ